MAKQVKSFRLNDSTINNLERLARHYNERQMVIAEQYNLKFTPHSTAEIIYLLVNEKINLLKEEGYDLK
jgi:hypothetical protein